MNKNQDKRIKEKYKEIADKRAMLRKYQKEMEDRIWDRYFNNFNNNYPFQNEYNVFYGEKFKGVYDLVDNTYFSDNPFSKVISWTQANLFIVKSKIYFDLCLFAKKIEEERVDFYFIKQLNQSSKINDDYYCIISVNNLSTIDTMINPILEIFDGDVTLEKYKGLNG